MGKMMASMSRRREIELELRECRSQLELMTQRGLAAPYMQDANDLTFGEEPDRLTIYLVTRDAIGNETRTKKSIQLNWADASIRSKLAYTDDERAKAKTASDEASRQGKKPPEPLSDGPAAKLKDCAAFNNWRYNVDAEFDKDSCSIRSITIQHIDLFGSRIGFVKFALNVNITKGGKTNPIPGVVFCRGPAVGMLVVLVNKDDNDSKYALLTVQARIPVGKFDFPEIPAGMLDDSNDFAGTAAKELREETGISITKADMLDLTSYQYKNTEYTGVYPSAGGCDELIRLYACELVVTQGNIKWLQSQCNGVFEEGEVIKLKIVPLVNLAESAPDMKALSALYLYEKYLRENGLKNIPQRKDVSSILRSA